MLTARKTPVTTSALTWLFPFPLSVGEDINHLLNNSQWSLKDGGKEKARGWGGNPIHGPGKVLAP